MDRPEILDHSLMLVREEMCVSALSFTCSPTRQDFAIFVHILKAAKPFSAAVFEISMHGLTLL